MNVFNKVTIVTLLLTISNWSFGDGHGHGDLNACNLKFTQAQIGGWEGEYMFRDGTGALNNLQYTNSVVLDGDLIKVTGAITNEEVEFQGSEYALGLDWETSIAWIDEEATTVTVIHCVETETGIMRETSWTGTNSLTGELVETIEQNVMSPDGGSFVGSNRTRNLNDENSTYYVWGWIHGSRVEDETATDAGLDASSETESESIWDTISGWFDQAERVLLGGSCVRNVLGIYFCF